MYEKFRISITYARQLFQLTSNSFSIKPGFNHWVAPVLLLFAFSLTACGGGGGGTGPLRALSISPADSSDKNSIHGIVEVVLSSGIDPAVLDQVIVDYRVDLPSGKDMLGGVMFGLAGGCEQNIGPAAARAAEGTASSGKENVSVPTEGRVSIALRHEFNPLDNVEGVLSYDSATSTVRYTPRFKLLYGAVYNVTVSGIPDGEGGTLAAQSTSFKTFVNPPTVCISYDPAGDVTEYERFTYDASGNQIKSARYTAAGTDGAWMTDDDVVSSFTASSYEDGNQTQSADYSGPGAAGPDGDPFTLDDVVVSFSTSSFDANSNRLSETSYFNAGDDGVPFTAVDVPQSRTEYDPAL